MRGGAENQLLVLSIEQVRFGHEVLVLYLKGEPELLADFESHGVRVISRFANKFPMNQVILLKNFFRKELHNLIIIHAHLPRAQIISALSKTHEQVLVCSRHDEDRFYPQAQKLLSALLFRLVNHSTDSWIAISNSVKEKMLSYRESQNVEDISVVHYGYSRRHIDNRSQFNENPYGIQTNDFVVGCVARLVWQKNHETLLRAFEIVYSHFKDAKLLLVGDGPSRIQLEVVAKELNISNAVIFAGKVSTVSEHLQMMDVFVLPSITEGFGLVLVEAMAENLPIIASDIPTLREVLGGSGELFDPNNPFELANKLIQCRQNETRDKYAKLAAERLRFFDPSQMCTRVLKVYEMAYKK